MFRLFDGLDEWGYSVFCTLEPCFDAGFAWASSVKTVVLSNFEFNFARGLVLQCNPNP